MLVSNKAFKSACRQKASGNVLPAAAAKALESPVLRKALINKAAPAGDRTAKFTISTSAVDLDNDTVDQNGWDLSVYQTNGVVLWMHDSMSLPIGRCVSIGVEGGALKATVEFLPADMPERGAFADAVYQMCMTGFLSATSVGFTPLDYEIANDRDDDDSWCPPVDFKRQKLLEFSIVTIPANSEALIDPEERASAPRTSPEIKPDEASLAVADISEKANAVAAMFARHKLLARIL
jgi:HK97 family phage prohead protease